MTWNPHITVAAIIERDNKFLFVEEMVNGEKAINQPAGHVEDGESFIEATIRETLEETGWHIKPNYLVAAYRWKCKKSETFFRFTFAAHALSHDANSPLDNGIIRSLWLDKTSLQNYSELLRSPMILDSIKRYLQGHEYPLDLFVDI